jgi:ubiquinone/menaquinone biosynthesis C-methylase UbiE
MSDYLSVVYNKEVKPYTSYPQKFISHLFDLYGMKQGRRLLEPGVGRGEFLRLFKELGLEVSGLDISEKARELSPDMDISVLDADASAWPYPDNSFDFIYSKSFVEHLNEPEKYFSESFRILKPGGTLITLTPDWESQHKTFYDDYTHVSPFTFVRLERMYSLSGFRNIKTSKFRQLPTVWKYKFLNYFCAAISPLVPVRTKNKTLRWSRELMLLSSAVKPLD